MTDASSLEPPGPLTAQVGDGQVLLRWPASPSPQVVCYSIYRRNPDGAWPSQPYDTSTSSDYLDLHAQNGVSYTYRVASVDAQGRVSLAQEISAVPQPAVVVTGQEAAAQPTLRSPAVRNRKPLIAVVAVLVALAAGYFLGSNQGEKHGYDTGYAEAQSQIGQRYDEGGAEYKKIFDTGYNAGRQSAVKQAKPAPQPPGKPVAFEQAVEPEPTQDKSNTKPTQGEQNTPEETQPTAQQIYAQVFGGFQEWNTDAPYLTLIAATDNKDAPYGLSARAPMQAGYNYYLCSDAKTGVCQAKRAG